MRRHPSYHPFPRPCGVVLGLALLTSTCNQSDHQTRGEAPDLILVVIDALRRDHVGAYGYSRPTTPFLDRLASEGILFLDAFSQGAETFHSTATLMTSRHVPRLAGPPIDAAIYGLDPEALSRHRQVPVLADENLTLAEALQAGGYDTFAVFTNPHHHRHSGFWQGFAEARYLGRESRDKPYPGAPRVVDACWEWLDGRGSALPYFVYLHFMDPHVPYLPARWARRLFPAPPGKTVYANGPPTPESRPSSDDLAHMQALYDAEIRAVDAALEKLVERLEESGGWSRTVLVVSSDHGEEFFDHGGLGHATTLEREMVATPLLFAGGGLSTGARAVPRREDLASNLDLAPTLLGLAGGAGSEGFEGRDLFRQQQPDSPAPLSVASVGPLRSATTERWHLILDTASAEITLYDRKSDPQWERDVSSEHKDVVSELLAHLLSLEERRVAEARQRSDDHAVALEPEILEQLEALGYLDR